MKIIDRYILSTFLKNYLISFFVLVGLYVVLDLVLNFDELVRNRPAAEAGGVQGAWMVLRGIADFYFYQMFVFFVHLSGVIPVVAAAFTLIRLSRFNELTALLAAGMPLLRITMPIFFAGLMLSGLLVVDQELIIPRIIPKLMRDRDELYQAASAAFPIRAMQDSQGGLLIAGRYTPPGPKNRARMEHVDVIERDATLAPVAHISADAATWNRREGHWELVNGRRVTGLRPGETPSGEQEIKTLDTGVTPEEIAIYRSNDMVDLLPTGRINRLIERGGRYGQADLLRVKHWRLTQWAGNFLLLLLAVPTVLTREPGSLKMAALRCVGLTGLCLGMMFLAYQFAGNPPEDPLWAQRWPALLAWAPLIVFGPAAVWLLDRVKS